MHTGQKRSRSDDRDNGAEAVGLPAPAGMSKLARLRAWREKQSNEATSSINASTIKVGSTSGTPSEDVTKSARMKKLAEWRQRRKGSNGSETASAAAQVISQANVIEPKKKGPMKFKGLRLKGNGRRKPFAARGAIDRFGDLSRAQGISGNAALDLVVKETIFKDTGRMTQAQPSGNASTAEPSQDLDEYLASIGVHSEPRVPSSGTAEDHGDERRSCASDLAQSGAISQAAAEEEEESQRQQKHLAGDGKVAGPKHGALTAEDLHEQFGIKKISLSGVTGHDKVKGVEAGAEASQPSTQEAKAKAQEEEEEEEGEGGLGHQVPMHDVESKPSAAVGGWDEQDENEEEKEEAFHQAFVRLAAARAGAGEKASDAPEAELQGQTSREAGAASSSSDDPPKQTGSALHSDVVLVSRTRPVPVPATTGAGAGAGAGAGSAVQTGEDLLDSLFVGNEWTGASDSGDASSSGTSVLQAFQAKQERRLRITGAGGASGRAIPVIKALYKPSASVANKLQHEVQNERAGMDLRVRGRDVPAPIDSWHQCGVSSSLLRALQGAGYDQPFAIQRQAVPCIMGGRDVIGVAKTGSGKTLAFVVPALRHALAQPPIGPDDGPLVIVLAPMRELAMQLYEETRRFGSAVGLRVVPVYGGAPIAEQIAGCKSRPHVIVGTPGRMIDLMALNGGKVLRLNRASMLVLDEADRMFDMGFGPQVEQVVSLMRPDKQAVLFSATFPEHIVKLAREMLIDPVEVVVGGGKSVASDAVRQAVEVRSPRTKFARLLQLLGEFVAQGQVLVFVDSKEQCDELFTSLLGAGYEPLTLHGGKDQQDRDETLDEFRKGECDLLVATSVAGRGLDVPGIRLVVNYDCPTHLEDYVHRVGRTGRAGRRGDAVTFIQPDQPELAPDLVRALSDANQVVPDALQSIAEEHKEKVRRGEAKKRRSGFTNRGRKVDGSELTEAGIGHEIEKLRMQMQTGALDEDTFLRLEAELEDKLKEVQARGSGKGVDASRGSSSQEPAVPAVALPSATELAKLRAKATAAEAALSSGRGGTEAAREAIAKYAEAEAAIQRASLDQGATALARAKAREAVDAMGGGMGGASGKARVSQELAINAYPKAARSRALRQETMQNISEWFGCGVVTTGIYVPLGRKPPVGQKPLALVVEGDSELSVRRARAELRRVLDEATEAVDEERFSLESAMAGGNGMGGTSAAVAQGMGQGYGK